MEPHWGFTTSPLVTGDLVVVLTGGSSNNAVTAFDKRTGATVWQAGSDVASYQSPMLARIGGRGAHRRRRRPVPVRARSAHRGARRGATSTAAAASTRRSSTPSCVAPDALLLTYRPDESILLRTSAAPSVAWSTRDLKLNYATPVTDGGLVFGYSGAFLSCVDAQTGAFKWRSRAPGDGFPLIVDDHLVVLTKDGRISVAEAVRRPVTTRRRR